MCVHVRVRVRVCVCVFTHIQVVSINHNLLQLLQTTVDPLPPLFLYERLPELPIKQAPQINTPYSCLYDSCKNINRTKLVFFSL